MIDLFRWVWSLTDSGWFWPLVVANAILTDVSHLLGWLMLVSAGVVMGTDIYIWHLKRKIEK